MFLVARHKHKGDLYCSAGIESYNTNALNTHHFEFIPHETPPVWFVLAKLRGDDPYDNFGQFSWYIKPKENV